MMIIAFITALNSRTILHQLNFNLVLNVRYQQCLGRPNYPPVLKTKTHHRACEIIEKWQRFYKQTVLIKPESDSNRLARLTIFISQIIK